MVKLKGKKDINKNLVKEINCQNILDEEITLIKELQKQFKKVNVLNQNLININFNLSNIPDPVNFNLPITSRLYFQECYSDYLSVFKIFPIEELLFLLFALLMEKSVIFVSKNIKNTTKCISTLICLLLPFKWCFTKVYNIT